MPHPLTTRLLNVLGPSRILLTGGSDTQLLADLLLAGCDAYTAWVGDGAGGAAPHPRCLQLPDVQAMAGTFDTLVVEAKPGTDILAALMQLFPYIGTPRNLVLSARGQERRQLETGLFLLDWRRHPGALTAAEYSQLSDNVLTDINFYQHVPGDAVSRWPVSELQKNRAQQMDMLRESGARADAHIVRYALAAQLIRPGDTVVDCACGLGYGSAVMSALSRAGRIIGVDPNPDTVDYATANYGHERLSFVAGDAAALRAIPDASVDMVVTMETLVRSPDWQAVLAEYRRILRPDGRLLAGVPDRWADATGRDPNPQHLHVFDWRTFADGLRRHFIIETRYLQTAPGGFKLQQAPRALQRLAADSTAEGEWILAVASVDPLADGKARRDDFTHPAFQQAFNESRLPVVGFGDGYENPYLYRSMIQNGERLMDNNVLLGLLHRAITESSQNSADLGGALAVLGYRILEARLAGDTPWLLDRIRAYLDNTETNREEPHIARWRISLSFLAGRLAALIGDRDQALAWYDATSNLEAARFSPILATKTVGAAFYAGVLHLVGFEDENGGVGGDEDGGRTAAMERARTYFTRGLNTALAAARSPATEIIGSEEAPVPFAMTELAEVLDMGSQCAAAINNLPHWRENPGLFWQQIDVKRFGLLTWMVDTVRINEALNAELRKLTAINQQLTNELRSKRSTGLQMNPKLAGLNLG